MNKIIVFVAVVATLLLTSCGSQKPATSSAPKSAVNSAIGQALPDEPCITLQEEAPAIRKYGNGVHFKEATARSLAEAQARAAFARSIAAALTTATEEIGVSLEKYAGDDATGRSVSDQSGESNDFVMSIAQEIVKNTHPIKTSRYLKPNNQYNIYVCLEYMGTENEMVDKAEGSLKDKISADDRAKLEKRHDDFRQRVLNTLKK
ncbi:MAG: hypothetical protein K2M55_02025 [Muribaculaceae bacterium]|nr:hypothetical protein [Muribaculaceae bacterium]